MSRAKKTSVAKRGEVCPRCGEVHLGCLGHSGRTGGACKKSPIRGAEVCSTHGGRAPQVKAMARRRLAEGAAFKALAEMDIEPLGDPMEALEGLAAEARAFQRWCAERVNELREHIRYTHGQGAEQLRAELALYERASDRAEKFLVDFRKLQIAEHPIKVEHSGQVHTIHDLLTRVSDNAPALRTQEAPE